MFNHFNYDKIQKKTQGSNSKDEFYKLSNFIGRKKISYLINILNI